MLEFITKYFNFISYGFELFAMITALFSIRKYRGTSTIIFVYYIIYVVFVEAIGATFFYYRSFLVTRFLINIGFNSTAWYNLFWMFGSILFMMYYIYNLLNNKKTKIILKAISVLFVLIILGHFFIYPQVFFKEHHAIYQLSGALVMLICVALYLLEFIKSDVISKAFNTFSFYALSALLIWWLLVTPILLFDVYNTDSDWDFVYLKRRVFVFANIFMYTCFAIGLIVSKPKYKNE
ncbi:hypothetical protein [uncultured Lacinutrix sp.]|uniref:hypothetical protein n=1 Tax=uncultured Lacinutrix sp. TaxID=574032 RepID=UPI00262B39A2|nr:hypothetical protein [uncultured Lacinutrix sp.]